MTKSVHLENLHKRTSKHARNPNLDNLLSELRELLEPAEKRIIAKFNNPLFPPLFLVGNPRSGTTFLMQLISKTGQFSVPTNLLSRFYYAPYIGAKIQQIITDKDFDFQNELGGFSSQEDAFSSGLGKTTGALAPNEIFHFWRRFLPIYDPQWISPEEEHKIDKQGLAAGIAAIEAVFKKPVATKAIIMQYNLQKLHEIFPNSLIVLVRRDPLFIMQSIYQARLDFYNTLDIWWSVKPKEFNDLQKMDAYHQIAGQVFFTEKTLTEGLSKIPEKNKIIVEYEKTCQNPSVFYENLRKKYGELGYELPKSATLPEEFSPSNKVRIPETEFKKLSDAYMFFSNST